MDIPIKTKKEIEIMQLGGQKLAKIFKELLLMVKPGVKISEIERKAWHLIEKEDGQPSFAMTPKYNWATCINLNEGIVHGIPDEERIKKGDLVSLDVGIYYKGFHTDCSWTIEVGTKKQKKFLNAGKKALKEAIREARPGKRIGDISQKIEKIIKSKGYSPIKKYTGHGVGRKLHEPPSTPCFLKEKIKKTPLIKPGMTLAIEVIYSAGSPEIIIDQKDGWTAKTCDGSLAACFEETIAVTKNKPLILTQLFE